LIAQFSPSTPFVHIPVTGFLKCRLWLTVSWTTLQFLDKFLYPSSSLCEQCFPLHHKLQRRRVSPINLHAECAPFRCSLDPADDPNSIHPVPSVVLRRPDLVSSISTTTPTPPIFSSILVITLAASILNDCTIT
jgi:hypothetical protein